MIKLDNEHIPMNFLFENANTVIDQIVKDGEIDLSEVGFMDPWTTDLLCLLLIERHTANNKKLILPKNSELLKYLKRMHFCEILSELGYKEELELLNKVQIPENYNLNIQEISHCEYRDEFDGKLERFMEMFKNFGLNEYDSRLATSLVGELGNNAFDHNLGSWPTDISGCIIVAQNYPKKKKIQIAIGDPGVGFLGSLKAAFPSLKTDIEAIKKGLGGNTGRIGELRGNGLKLIQQWTIDNFSGKLAIQSGEGLVIVGENGITEAKRNKILGTLAQLMIYYK